MVARCLGSPDHCDTVYADVQVKRTSAQTGQVNEVTQRFAVACRRKRAPYNYDDHTDS